MSRNGSARRILGVENSTPNEKGRLSGLAETRRICALQAPHEMAGDRWKSQNRKNMYLSPYVEEPLNSKVIKSFVPELRCRKWFSCFEIPMFYVYTLGTIYLRFAYPYLAMVQNYLLIYIYIYIYTLKSVYLGSKLLLRQVSRVFVNGLGDLVSIPSRVIPKIFKMVLDTFLLNTQQYKVRVV